jgi:DNA-binding MarR family transcriptional regulator
VEFPSARFQKDSDASTGFLFIRAYNKWSASIKTELRKLGITHPQFVLLTVLNYLSQSGNCATQASIAKMADMDVMTASQIIRGLESKGYLIRTVHPDDTRANAVNLLPKGQEAVRAALPVVEKTDDSFFGALSADEETFRNYLQRLL